MASSDQARLEIRGGPRGGETVPLVGPSITLGRQPGNDLVATEPGVSRRHAVITAAGDGHNVRDLASSNGTFVNRRNIAVDDRALDDGDAVGLGPGEVTYVYRRPEHDTVELSMTQPITLGGVQVAPDGGITGPLTRPVELRAQPAEEEALYDGSVRLDIDAEGNLGLVISLTQQIRGRPDIRLLRLSSTPRAGVTIWLGLREPVLLRAVLGEMVSVVETTPVTNGGPDANGGERALNVLLRTQEAAG